MPKAKKAFSRKDAIKFGDEIHREAKFFQEMAGGQLLDAETAKDVLKVLRAVRRTVKDSVTVGPAFTRIDCTSFEDFKKQHKILSNAHNRDIALADSGFITRKDQTKRCKVRDAYEKELGDIMLAGPHAKRVCNTNVHYQASSAYEGNYELEEELAKKFPQGIADAESDQGFFYIHDSFVKDVIEWLKPKCEKDSVDFDREFYGLSIK